MPLAITQPLLQLEVAGKSLTLTCLKRVFLQFWAGPPLLVAFAAYTPMMSIMHHCALVIIMM